MRVVSTRNATPSERRERIARADTASFCEFLKCCASSLAPMRPTRSPLRRGLTAGAASLTLLSVLVLLASDAAPTLFRTDLHGRLATLALVLSAFGCLLPHLGRSARPLEWAKALIAAFAFLFWAANQICLNQTTATVLNDIAIALFALDVFLVVAGWPPVPGDASSSYREPERRPWSKSSTPMTMRHSGAPKR
jgi:hypothetical protein